MTLMKGIKRIKAKIERIERLLTEVKDELEILSKESQFPPKKVRAEQPLLSEEELQSEYEKLYKEFIAKTSKDVITEFIRGKSKVYLKAFCKANNLPLDATKVSKERVADEVMQWLVQRKVITKKAT